MNKNDSGKNRPKLKMEILTEQANHGKLRKFKKKRKR